MNNQILIDYCQEVSAGYWLLIAGSVYGYVALGIRSAALEAIAALGVRSTSFEVGG